MVEYYDCEDAEEYLDNISDDIPLFTNTREGMFMGSIRTAPVPLETNSDLFVNPMREKFANRRPNPIPQRSSMPHGKVAAVAAQFADKGGIPFRLQQQNRGGVGGSDQRNGGTMVGLAGLQMDDSPESTAIPGLQDGIADLQMDDDNADDAEEENFDEIPFFSRSPNLQPQRSSPLKPPLLVSTNRPTNQSKSPGSDSSPGLPDKLMNELALTNSEIHDVSPHVIQGLVQIMHNGSQEKAKKATVAMCNLCCDSQTNRQHAGDAGAVQVLIEMLQDSKRDKHTHRLATACICNLSTDPPLKDAIAHSGAIPFLARIIDTEGDSVDARAAIAHACATLWSLCVDMDHIKPMVAQVSIMRSLMRQLRSPELFVRGQACGCIGEVCIGNKQAKSMLSSLNIIPDLIDLLSEADPATQRLAASALCNLSANHEENKRLSRAAGLIDALSTLLLNTDDDAVRSAAAGGLYNLVTAADREVLERRGVVEIMRTVPISQNINLRLGIKERG